MPNLLKVDGNNKYVVELELHSVDVPTCAYAQVNHTWPTCALPEGSMS